MVTIVFTTAYAFESRYSSSSHYRYLFDVLIIFSNHNECSFIGRDINVGGLL
ncbi:hypothetical protein D083_3068 [Dickeya solani RNS 08.23.3.1.A]|nr:hypothetical protein D083_3068 [Dickeya solani RNS 08.23.3.1.A]